MLLNTASFVGEFLANFDDLFGIIIGTGGAQYKWQLLAMKNSQIVYMITDGMHFVFIFWTNPGLLGTYK